MTRTVFTGLALSLAMAAGFTTPASAEFFGCNERNNVRTYTAPAPRYSRHTTQEYSAQSRAKYTYYRAGSTQYAAKSDRSRW